MLITSGVTETDTTTQNNKALKQTNKQTKNRRYTNKNLANMENSNATDDIVTTYENSKSNSKMRSMKMKKQTEETSQNPAKSQI